MNYEQQYLGLIIEKYEKETLKKQEAKGLKLMTVKSIDDMKSITSITRNTTKSFPGSKYDFKNRPEESKNRTKKNIDSKALKKMGLSGVSEKSLEDYLEKCFGCDARFQFDFQFLPPSLVLDSLLSLLSEMDQLLDQVAKSFDSKKKVQQLCSIASLFDGVPCPQDILTIILAIKVLLGKYSSISLSLKFDWLTLLGPIIQSLVQLLSSLVSMAFDAIIGPIDCTFATMASGLDLIRNSDSSFSTPKNKTPQSNFIESNNKLPVSNNDSSSQITSVGTFTNSIETESTGFGSSLVLESAIGGSFKLNELLSVPAGQSDFFDLSMPEQLIISVSEARNFLSDFKNKILETVNSLNGLVKSGKFFEIKNLTIAIFLAELIAFLIQLLNTDFKSLCTDPKKIPLLEEFIKDISGADRVTVETQEKRTIATVVNTNGVKEIIELNSCSIAHNSVNANEIQKILAEIERLSNGT